MRSRIVESGLSIPGTVAPIRNRAAEQDGPAMPRGCGRLKLLTMNVRGLQDSTHSDFKLVTANYAADGGADDICGGATGDVGLGELSKQICVSK